MNIRRRQFLLLLVLLFGTISVPAQCGIYEVPLGERVDNSQHIVLGKLIEQHPYQAPNNQIYTLNILEITSWLKGYQPQSTVGVITIGGVLGDRAQVTHPALQLKPWNEYVIFLEADNQREGNAAYRQAHPQIIQALPYADAQGAFTKQQGIFHDLLVEPKQTERELLAKIADLSGETALTPAGETFTARTGDTYPLSQYSEEVANKITMISNFAPNPTQAGTIDPADFITINGSGFGGTAGTVFYSNADDGGATLTASGVASDNLAWSDTQIQNKPAGNGGTGPININGSFSSATDLTIDYAFIDINSSFAGFGSTTRQAYKHVDIDGAGGYTFQYNNAFASNTAAVAAWERALQTWVCATSINFKMGGSNTAVSTVGNDGTDVVFFDASLPNGVLGRANSFFQASATGACNQTNTVWYLGGIDVQFKPDPPAGCCTWNFGPGASAFLEFDFETVALHELGHAHGLGHVISPGQVMHFAVSNGVDARVLAANDVAAGQDKMTTNFQPLCFNPAGVNGNMTALVPAACVLDASEIQLAAVRQSTSSVLLSWDAPETQSVQEFEVQRSLPGVPFEVIGHADEANKDASQLAYNFHDDESPASQTWLYRLKMTDANGHSSFSNAVRVSGVQENVLEIYPSVSEGRVTMRGSFEEDFDGVIAIANTTGKVLKNLPLKVVAGSFVQSFDLTNLPAGMYFYTLSGNQIRQTGRLVIQK